MNRLPAARCPIDASFVDPYDYVAARMGADAVGLSRAGAANGLSPIWRLGVSEFVGFHGALRAEEIGGLLTDALPRARAVRLIEESVGFRLTTGMGQQVVQSMDTMAAEAVRSALVRAGEKALDVIRGLDDSVQFDPFMARGSVGGTPFVVRIEPDTTFSLQGRPDRLALLLKRARVNAISYRASASIRDAISGYVVGSASSPVSESPLHFTNGHPGPWDPGFDPKDALAWSGVVSVVRAAERDAAIRRQAAEVARGLGALREEASRPVERGRGVRAIAA